MRRAGAKPRFVEPDLHAVAVQPNDELLPGANAESLAVALEGGLRVRDESCALRLDLRPGIARREQLLERQERVAVGLELRRLLRFERTRS